jgi:hypothetical protein
MLLSFCVEAYKITCIHVHGIGSPDIPVASEQNSANSSLLALCIYLIVGFLSLGRIIIHSSSLVSSQQ